MEIVYAPVGSETERMTHLREGDGLELIGPLGVGFGILSERRAVLVGGGRGVAPLLFLGERLARHGHETLLLYGYRSAEVRWPVDCSFSVLEASEDGSLGHKGTVVSLLDDLSESGRLDVQGDALYSCGPTVMLSALASWASERGFPLETSLETHFGCGYGVCAGCAVPIRGGSGYGTFAFACREGPVFPAEEVDWNGLAD
jgi:dihydroorotate dehydrogenase electron transfer subunit